MTRENQSRKEAREWLRQHRASSRFTDAERGMADVVSIEDRCAECGHLADRHSPTEPDILGCGRCFPHWPAGGAA